MRKRKTFCTFAVLSSMGHFTPTSFPPMNVLRITRNAERALTPVVTRSTAYRHPSADARLNGRIARSGHLNSCGLGRCARPRTLISLRLRTSDTKPYSAINAMAAAQAPFPSLVSAAWLMDHLADVKVLDATWYMPNVTTKDAVEEFRTSRLPGAQFFNLDGVCDWDTDLPHMLPTEAQFAAAADALGISNDDAVVIYDRTGLFSAPRAWWTWHVFGHDKVAVLDGGLPAWTAAGGDLDLTEAEEEDIHKATAAAQSVTPTTQTTYRAKLRTNEVRTRADMVLNIQRQDEQVVDARPAARWRGKAPEPRPGLEMGHIPGSFNVPWDSMLRDGGMLPPKELAKLFKKAGVEVDVEGRPLVFTCGSGTTAAILGLAARQLNPPREFAIYDGSWSEWGKPELTLPVATAAEPDD